MLRYVILVIGLLAIASSVLSVRPSSDHRYRELQAREALNPHSVTPGEWVISKDDEGFTAVGLIFIGIPAFIIVTLGSLILTALIDKLRPIRVVLGVAWIFLGGFLHAFVWLA